MQQWLCDVEMRESLEREDEELWNERRVVLFDEQNTREQEGKFSVVTKRNEKWGLMWELTKKKVTNRRIVTVNERKNIRKPENEENAKGK